LIALPVGESGPVPAGEVAGRWLIAMGAEVPAGPPSSADLIGLQVTDATRGLIGMVTDVIVTGANDVLVVCGDTYGEVLVPVIDDVIVRIDHTQGAIAVRLLPGLIDEGPE
jgi:16S rRNA processing protein RimM